MDRAEVKFFNNTRITVFGILFQVLVLTACQPSSQEAGVHTLVSDKQFSTLRSDLINAIVENGYLVSDGACGKCSIKTIEVSETDSEIISIYRPGLSLRMMQAGSTAGSDAPLRFYLSKTEDGGAKLTYHQPSAALAVYDAPGLKPIGKELDVVFANIIHSLQNE
jgi:uncharacterized protein (DUF302 family)